MKNIVGRNFACAEDIKPKLISLHGRPSSTFFDHPLNMDSSQQEAISQPQYHQVMYRSSHLQVSMVEWPSRVPTDDFLDWILDKKIFGLNC